MTSSKILDYPNKAITTLRKDGARELFSLAYKRMRIDLKRFILSRKIIRTLSKSRTEKLLQKEIYNCESDKGTIELLYDFRGIGTYRLWNPAQLEYELNGYLDFLQEKEPETYVELGLGRGGTFLAVLKTVDSIEKAIGIDMDFDSERKEIIQNLTDKEILFIDGNSQNSATMKELEKALNGEKADFMLIDGDHTYEGVKKDFLNYRGSVAGGIAFHDIKAKEDCHIEVDKLWQEIKQLSDTQEVIDTDYSLNSPQPVIKEGNSMIGHGIGIIKSSEEQKSKSKDT